ncbi:hypothetical protein CASFOL_005842 [Castilleja foliolosa]|uniref:Uncharacterized protein n=1 Tax=Castilleja foliolosa TaxID=1961234 RepID=A0ABD3E5M6_9LAMI
MKNHLLRQPPTLPSPPSPGDFPYKQNAASPPPILINGPDPSRDSPEHAENGVSSFL